MTSQTTPATNNSGMKTNDAQNISVPAYSHQGQGETSWLKPWQVPCQPLAVETNPATGMARHSRRLVTRKINLMMRKIRDTGASLPEKDERISQLPRVDGPPPHRTWNLKLPPLNRAGPQL